MTGGKEKSAEWQTQHKRRLWWIDEISLHSSTVPLMKSPFIFMCAIPTARKCRREEKKHLGSFLILILKRYPPQEDSVRARDENSSKRWSRWGTFIRGEEWRLICLSGMGSNVKHTALPSISAPFGPDPPPHWGEAGMGEWNGNRKPPGWFPACDASTCTVFTGTRRQSWTVATAEVRDDAQHHLQLAPQLRQLLLSSLLPYPTLHFQFSLSNLPRLSIALTLSFLLALFSFNLSPDAHIFLSTGLKAMHPQ